jgi:hypothetical protein
MTDSTPSAKPEPPRQMHRFSIGLNVLVQIFLLFVLFLLVNYLGYRHYVREDLTPNQDYTLSEATTNYLRKLSKDVDITLLFTRESPIMPEVRALIDEYRNVKRARIRTDEVDPARDVERAEQLKLEHSLSLKGNGILVRANNRTRFIPEEEIVIRGLNGDRANPSVDFRGEDALTSAIIGLIEGGKRKFYYIIGKGDATGKGSEPSYLSLVSLGKQQNFEVTPIHLTEISNIPEDASGVILVGLRYDLSEREIDILQTYWQGKRSSLLVLLDPNGDTPRLKKLLETHGVVPRADRVLYAESTSSGPRKEFSVQTLFEPNSPITAPYLSVTGSLSGQSQSLDLKLDSAELRANQITVTPLMKATERYWGETRYLLDLPVADDADTKPPMYLAASVERGQVSDERLRVDSARMVIVGNALLLDPTTRLAIHQDFISSALNWMMNRERLIGLTPKRKQTFRLELTDHQRKTTFWVTAIVFPGLVLMFGFMIWSHRRV